MELDDIKKELRNLQMVEFNTLIELDRVCKKLDLRYYLFSGTLLGAVRHKGFIPWDDDIDVVMLRADYDRLREEAPKELREQYFLQSLDTDSDCPIFHTKLRDSNTTFIETPVAQHKMNHGIYIDIFPLDNFPNNSYIQKILWALLSVIGNMALLKVYPMKRNTILKEIAQKVVDVFPISWQKLFRMYINLCKMIKKKTKYVAFSTWPTDPLNHILYLEDWFHNPTFLPFEGVQLPVPEFYKEILTQLFGDYHKMPPVEERIPHHGTSFTNTTESYRIYDNNRSKPL